MKQIIKTTYHLDDITKAIANAQEGDEIIISKGTYYSYPWTLKSNITITIEEEANIYFSTDINDYLEKTFIRFEGVECYSFHPLIYSYKKKNITIQGKGKIFGNGYVWWKNKKLQAESCNRLCYAEANKIPLEERVPDLKTSCLRPDFIELVDGENIHLKDFTIVDSPMWMIHPVYCKNVHIENVSLYSDGPNTDGIDPDSCQDVLIENCSFHTGDDGIAINSGLNEDGMRVNIPCKNVEIRNCSFYKGHASVAIGSAMSGGVENIYIHDLKIFESERGIRIKSLPGRGGYVKDVKVENIQMGQIEKEAIDITMNYPSSTSIPLSTIPPHFYDFSFKNVEIQKAKVGISIIGLSDSYVENVHFENLTMKDVKTKLMTLYLKDDLSDLEEKL